MAPRADRLHPSEPGEIKQAEPHNETCGSACLRYSAFCCLRGGLHHRAVAAAVGVYLRAEFFLQVEALLGRHRRIRVHARQQVRRELVERRLLLGKSGDIDDDVAAVDNPVLLVHNRDLALRVAAVAGVDVELQAVEIQRGDERDGLFVLRLAERADSVHFGRTVLREQLADPVVRRGQLVLLAEIRQAVVFQREVERPSLLTYTSGNR